MLLLFVYPYFYKHTKFITNTWPYWSCICICGSLNFRYKWYKCGIVMV